MNFYERMNRKEVRVPSKFDMSCSQLYDIKKYAPEIFDVMYICFKFGYLQGIRAAEMEKRS